MSNASLLDLTKKFELTLEKAKFNPPVMATKLAIDVSGSMHDEFSCGYVQSTLDLFLTAAMKYDDDKSLEVGTFNTSFRRHADAKASDFGTYVRNNGLRADGGTGYAQIIEKFILDEQDNKKPGFFAKMGFGKASQEKPAKLKYLAIITDGEAYDNTEFEKLLRDVNAKQTYVQFIAIGTQIDTAFLNSVANRFDNVDLIHLPNPKKVSDEEFFDKICHSEFVAWCNTNGPKPSSPV